MRAQLRSILYASRVDDAEALITTFRDTWQVNAPQFVQFMNKNYFDSVADKRRWMYCHREGISFAWINTNNYIESWHNTLKKHFFKDKSLKRLDHVIHTLVHGAIPHYEQRCIRHQLQVGPMASTVRDALVAQDIAQNHMDLKRAQNPNASFLIPTNDPATFKVESFQDPLTLYDIEVDWKKGLSGHVINCNCPLFLKMGKCCKHIAVAIIELPYTEFSHAGHWEPRDSDEIPADLNAPATDAEREPVSILQLKHYLHAFSSLLNTLDASRPVTNHEELLSALAKGLALCEEHVPILPEHSLNRKRQRQRH